LPEDAYYALLVAIGRLIAANPRFHQLPMTSLLDDAIEQQRRDDVEAAEALPDWVRDAMGGN